MKAIGSAMLTFACVITDEKQEAFDKYALIQPKHHSNSSHPLMRLPKTSMRWLVVTMTRPFSLSNRVMCSWMPSAFEEKSPSREAKPRAVRS
jgi:hypothetical protein